MASSPVSPQQSAPGAYWFPGPQAPAPAPRGGPMGWVGSPPIWSLHTTANIDGGCEHWNSPSAKKNNVLLTFQLSKFPSPLCLQGLAFQENPWVFWLFLN